MIEWCEHHKNDPPAAGDDDDNRRKTTDIEEWDQKFMQVDQEMLFEIILVCSRSPFSVPPFQLCLCICPRPRFPIVGKEGVFRTPTNVFFSPTPLGRQLPRY